MSEREKNFAETPHGFATDEEANDALAERLRKEMAEFVREVKAARDEEVKQEQLRVASGKFSAQTAHFLDPRFDPEELTLVDKRVWDKIRQRIITPEEFDEYRKGVESPKEAAFLDRRIRELAADRTSIPADMLTDTEKRVTEMPYSSRRTFYNFLANEYVELDMRRELEGFRKERAAKNCPPPEEPI